MMRKDNWGEKSQGCKLWHVNSFEYFDYTGLKQRLYSINVVISTDC
jgi:hypothetical protein